MFNEEKLMGSIIQFISNISDALINFASGMPHWLGAILLSMVPITELRATIPVAISMWEMHPVWAFVFAVIGNMIPVPFIILFIRPIFAWMKKFKIFRKLVVKLEERGASKISTVEKYKFWGLFIFVAIPAPGTGAWTGSLIAGLMNMRLKDAIPSILLGVVTAAIIVTLVTTGAINIFS